MPNMQLNKTPMPEQSPDTRNTNFTEVALGYTAEQAKSEAERCLGCKHKPCVKGCPVGVDIPAFITPLKSGDADTALEILRRTNALPAICGRVCPQETQCEELCVRGLKGEPVAIGRLERYAADSAVPKAFSGAAPTGRRAAVIGTGPAGLTCAGVLAAAGVEVTMFEAFHTPGGVLIYGIPEFRLPKAVAGREIESLKDMGVKIETNMVVGRVLSIDDLFARGFGAVFIGVGAGLPTFMKVPGESLIGVYSANEFLTRINLMKAYEPDAETPAPVFKNAAVVGGGNVAMDAARCAKRLSGGNVTVVYRRGEAELPARKEEIHHAMEEGIVFKFLTAPVEILGGDDFRVSGMVCEEMELGEPDASGRRRPVPKPGSRFTVECDCVISAIGTSPNPLLRQTERGLEFDRWGCVVTNPDTGETSRPGVYAGGDISTGAATVIKAMGAGKIAAESMIAYLAGK